MTELGLRGDKASSSETYETFVGTTNDQSINSHINTILTDFKMPNNAKGVNAYHQSTDSLIFIKV